MIHLNKLGMSPRPRDIEVVFNNKLIDVEEIDRLEFSDTLMSTIMNSVTSLSDISTKIQAPIDGKVLKAFFERHLSAIGLENILKMADNKDVPPPKIQEF